MNRLLGLTVGKNETMRYLMPMLAHSAYVFDEHFFYDDGSTDGTPEVASGLGCTVRHRPSNGCAFTEDEGTFRGEAWRSFEDAVGPEVGDWVFVLDCDEFIVTTKSARPTDVRRQIPLPPRGDVLIREIWSPSGPDVRHGSPLQHKQ